MLCLTSRVFILWFDVVLGWVGLGCATIDDATMCLCLCDAYCLVMCGVLVVGA